MYVVSVNPCCGAELDRVIFELHAKVVYNWRHARFKWRLSESCRTGVRKRMVDFVNLILPTDDAFGPRTLPSGKDVPNILPQAQDRDFAYR